MHSFYNLWDTGWNIKTDLKLPHLTGMRLCPWCTSHCNVPPGQLEETQLQNNFWNHSWIQPCPSSGFPPLKLTVRFTLCWYIWKLKYLHFSKLNQSPLYRATSSHGYVQWFLITNGIEQILNNEVAMKELGVCVKLLSYSHRVMHFHSACLWLWTTVSFNYRYYFRSCLVWIKIKRCRGCLSQAYLIIFQL